MGSIISTNHTMTCYFCADDLDLGA